MSKTDFPKIKKSSSLPIREPMGVEDQFQVSETPKNNWPARILMLSVIILIAQLGLLIANWKIYQSVQSASDGYLAADSRAKSRALIKNVEDVTVSKKMAKRGPPEPQTIADFNGNGLLTNFNTRVYPNKSDNSTSIIKLDLDADQRFGSSGRSLMVAFNFENSTAESALLMIDVPVIDIARFQRMALRMLASAGLSQGDEPYIQIEMISTDGDVVVRGLDELFSFWKKYDIDLWQGRSVPQEFLLKQIKIRILHNASHPAGKFYLDDMGLE